MRVAIAAVGRLKGGPERALVEDYQARFDRTGRALGLGPLTITEVDDRKGGGPAGEAALLRRAVPEGHENPAPETVPESKRSSRCSSNSLGWRACASRGGRTWRS